MKLQFSTDLKVIMFYDAHLTYNPGPRFEQQITQLSNAILMLDEQLGPQVAVRNPKLLFALKFPGLRLALQSEFL